MGRAAWALDARKGIGAQMHRFAGKEQPKLLLDMCGAWMHHNGKPAHTTRATTTDECTLAVGSDKTIVAIAVCLYISAKNPMRGQWSGCAWSSQQHTLVAKRRGTLTLPGRPWVGWVCPTSSAIGLATNAGDSGMCKWPVVAYPRPARTHTCVAMHRS